MSHPNITELLDASFNDFVEQNPNVIIDFWAPWCGPCKSFAPVFEAASDKYPDVKFVKVNVDEAQPIAAKFGIRSIPTLIGIKNGKVTLTRTGSMPASQFDGVMRSFSGAGLSFDD